MSCYEHCHANQNVRRSGKHNNRAFSSLTSPSSRHWTMDCLQQSMLKWLSYFLIRFPTCRVVSTVLPFLSLFSFLCKKVHKFQCLKRTAINASRKKINRGYYMAARRYEISLRVFKNTRTRREISYLQAAM